MNFISCYLKSFFGEERSIRRNEAGSQLQRYISSGKRIHEILSTCKNVTLTRYSDYGEREHNFSYSDVVELLGEDIFNTFENNRIDILNKETTRQKVEGWNSHLNEMWICHLFHSKIELVYREMQKNQNDLSFFWIDYGLSSKHGEFTEDTFDLILNKEFRNNINGIHFVRANWRTRLDGPGMMDFQSRNNIEFSKQYSVAGGFFGGDRKSLLKLYDAYKFCLTILIQRGLCPSDEDVFYCLLANNLLPEAHIHETFKECMLSLLK